MIKKSLLLLTLLPLCLQTFAQQQGKIKKNNPISLSNKWGDYNILRTANALDCEVQFIINPPGPVSCPGTITVSVYADNPGDVNVTSLTMGWSVDGVVQIPSTWNGLIIPGFFDTIPLTSFTFAQATTYDIKAWITSVNGISDANQSNDTVQETRDFHTVFIPQFYFDGCQLECVNAPDYVSFNWIYNGNHDFNSPDYYLYQPRANGFYTLIATTQQGCHVNAIDTLSVSAHSFAIQASPSVSFCPGDSATLTINSDATLLDYSWSTGSTSSTIVVHDSSIIVQSSNTSEGCLLIDSIYIGWYDVPSPTVTIINDSILIASDTANTHQWYFNGVPVTSEVGDTLIIHESGTYYCVSTSVNGCVGQSDPMFVDYTFVGSIVQNEQIHIYPNPAFNELHVSLTDMQIETYLVTDCLGREILSGSLNSSVATISLRDISSGVYYLKLNAKNNFKVIPFLKN